MLETISNIKGLEIYSPKGIFVGVVDEVIIDLSTMKASGLFVENPNPVLVEDNISISVPFSWIGGIGDVVVLKAFPNRVAASAAPPRERTR